ncbi:hypothetical protein Droror1_Dr00017759, partial [Drosera rotundifolia]
ADSRPFVTETNAIEYEMYEQPLGPIQFIQKEDEMLITSQEDDVTLELLDSLFDTERPNLVALATTEFERFCDSPSNGGLLAYDLEQRARHESCTVDVLPEEEAKDLRSDVADVE